MILNKMSKKTTERLAERNCKNERGLIVKKSKQKRQKKRHRMTPQEMVEKARKVKASFAKEPREESNTTRRAEKLFAVKRRKCRHTRDRELIEEYAGEVVDLTDLATWGEFEEEYQQPTGAYERNKMLKKAEDMKLDEDEESSEDNFDHSNDDPGQSENAQDDDVEEFRRQMEARRDGHDGYDEAGEVVQEQGSEDIDLDINDDGCDVDEDKEDMTDLANEFEAEFEGETKEESESDEETMGDPNEDDADGKPIEKKPFKGPLAPQRQHQKQSVLDGVDFNNDDYESKNHEKKKLNSNANVKPKRNTTCTKKSNHGEESVEVQMLEDNVDLTAAEKDSVKEWDLFSIHNCILKALAELKYTEPTEIQSECLTPAIRDRLDILGAAETGSGKTLAFGIPVVNRLLYERERNKTGALILTPTRELAIQIKKHLTDITKFTSLHVVTIVGGLCHEKQMRLVRKRPEIIVATPGRLFEFLQEDPSFQQQIVAVRCLVIDEADRMVQEGHFEEMKLIIKFMNQNRVGKCQIFVFSATLTMDPHLPERVIEKKHNKKLSRLDQLKNLLGMIKPKVIDLSTKIGTAETLTESRIFCEKPEQKDALLYYFICMHPGRTLVFCNSIDCVRRLKSVLETVRLRPMTLHAEMQQRQRLRQLDRFAADPNSLLIATDVAARGLDIKDVEHVIHFNVSKASETYIHRSGRTARVKRNGLSVMLVDGRELPQYRRILHVLKRNEDLPAFPIQDDIMKACRARIAKARELEVLEHRHRKRSKTNSWFAKCAQEADIELDDNMLIQTDWTEDRKERVKVEKLHRELEVLLRKRLIPLNQRVGEVLRVPDKNPLKLVRDAKGVLE
ncbi:ATP-dependent RNA helicase DDX24-like [Tropilaelaps mercedesae]|uniref:ATP-dependent RNA helicase n=1 Tax=Tropilaelaps mercedesae TaxID=418985 RepID=A0A1V9XC51_9ACAR|nr:ATP-dependent RNA helicase DDX24-like [Tropilaelaps mercedesae]